MTWTP
jgi:hypothetical protein